VPRSALHAEVERLSTILGRDLVLVVA